MTLTSFKNRYLHTPIGYSVHALLLDENGKIIGCHHLVPFYYIFDCRKNLFAYGSGTMIKKEHRNFLTYRRLITESQKYIVDELGCTFLLGFPNNNSYPVQKKGMKRQDVGDLSIYFLPVKIGSFKVSLRWLNPLSVFLSKSWIDLSFLSCSRKKHEPLVHRDYESFNRCRYAIRKNFYIRIEEKNYSGYYCVKNYEGKMIAFVLDIQPISKKFFDGFVRTMMKELSSTEIDGIMFVGYLPFTPMTLVKIPKKFEPKTFHFVGTIFNKDEIDDRIFDVSNWYVSLADYDLV